jgi:hypothetical protein
MLQYMSVLLDDAKVTKRRTVAQDEFANTSKIHSNGTEEVVVAVQTDETGWRYSSLETTESKDGRGVWDQETNQAKESRVGCKYSIRQVFIGKQGDSHTESLCQISMSGCIGLEEQSFILLRSQIDSHLATQR